MPENISTETRLPGFDLDGVGEAAAGCASAPDFLSLRDDLRQVDNQFAGTFWPQIHSAYPTLPSPTTTLGDQVPDGELLLGMDIGGIRPGLDGVVTIEVWRAEPVDEVSFDAEGAPLPGQQFRRGARILTTYGRTTGGWVDVDIDGPFGLGGTDILRSRARLLLAADGIRGAEFGGAVSLPSAIELAIRWTDGAVPSVNISDFMAADLEGSPGDCNSFSFGVELAFVSAELL